LRYSLLAIFPLFWRLTQKTLVLGTGKLLGHCPQAACSCKSEILASIMRVGTASLSKVDVLHLGFEDADVGIISSHNAFFS
jgi:hypothetical protein